LAAAAAGSASVYGPVPQGTFLTTLGIHLRTAKLLERASTEQQRALRAALFRLTDASAMGELFKVLVLAGPDAPAPPGFHQPTLRPC
jgi:SAM-dependent MidA family methyltransferase